MTIGRIPSVEGGIQPTIFDAKGDLIVATAADTPARLAVGSSGDTLVADSAATTGLRWQGNYSAGKNKIINGDFAINQRGFTSGTSNGYGQDRWLQIRANGTVTYSVETFTLGTAPVTGYEAKNFARQVVSGHTGSSTDYAVFAQRIESVRTLANQTATVSFWAKAASGTPKIAVTLRQSFGTGGSPSSEVDTYAGQVTLSTSWTRYSVTVAIPSISGKTLGTANDDQLVLYFFTSAGSNYNSITGSLGSQNGTFDFWGVQLEAGSVPTAFQTATGTLQGELAACQRYYFRNTPTGSDYGTIGFGTASGTTRVFIGITPPVTMRVEPTAVEYTGLRLEDGQTGTAVTAISIASNSSGPYFVYLTVDVASGLTQYRPYYLGLNNSATGYLGLSAEL